MATDYDGDHVANDYDGDHVATDWDGNNLTCGHLISISDLTESV